MGSASAGSGNGGGPPAQGQRAPRPRTGNGSAGGPRGRGAGKAPPDLAAVAREAVVGFLREASTSTEQEEPGPAEELAGPGGDLLTALAEPEPEAADLAGGQVPPMSAAERAAAISVATLDKVEAAAERLEADIAAARQEQARLRSKAGTAAEEAVRAAQDAWSAAGSAEAASTRARKVMKVIGGYAIATAVLLLVQLVILVLFSGILR
jgi:hypothetical protein